MNIDKDMDINTTRKGLNLSPLDLMVSQAQFRLDFFEMHPECKKCQYVDIPVMDYWIYPATKERHCKICDRYKGW